MPPNKRFEKLSQQVWSDVAAEWAEPGEEKNVEYMQYYNPFTLVMKREGWFPLQPGMISLEPGCGIGIFSAMMVKDWGARAVCLDFVRDALILTKSKFQQAGIEGEFIQADMIRLPFKDGSFDMVFNQGTIEHFPPKDRQKVLDEMARVSRRYVAVFVPNSLNPVRALAKWAQKLLGKWRWGLERPYNPWELKRRLDNAGIKVTKQAGVNFFKLFYAFRPMRPILYPMLRRLMGDKLFAINAGDGFLNRILGDEIYAMGVKKNVP